MTRIISGVQRNNPLPFPLPYMPVNSLQPPEVHDRGRATQLEGLGFVGPWELSRVLNSFC